MESPEVRCKVQTVHCLGSSKGTCDIPQIVRTTWCWGVILNNRIARGPAAQQPSRNKHALATLNTSIRHGAGMVVIWKQERTMLPCCLLLGCQLSTKSRLPLGAQQKSVGRSEGRRLDGVLNSLIDRGYGMPAWTSYRKVAS